MSPARTDAKSVNIGVQAFERAAKACPVIIAGGYSQGAAVMHNVIGGKLSESIKSKIAGVVLYGDTRNKQDRGKIPNFPKEKVKVFCNSSDGVCGGQLLVNTGHLLYADKIGPGASFLADRVNAYGKGGSAGKGSGGEATEGLKGGGLLEKGGKGGKGESLAVLLGAEGRVLVGSLARGAYNDI